MKYEKPGLRSLNVFRGAAAGEPQDCLNGSLAADIYGCETGAGNPGDCSVGGTPVGVLCGGGSTPDLTPGACNAGTGGGITCSHGANATTCSTGAVA